MSEFVLEALNQRRFGFTIQALASGSKLTRLYVPGNRTKGNRKQTLELHIWSELSNRHIIFLSHKVMMFIYCRDKMRTNFALLFNAQLFTVTYYCTVGRTLAADL